MPVVIVESPSKAKTINKYLGKEFEVFASFGHIRDLPAKDGSVDPDNDFEMSWLVEPDSNKRLKDIEKALKNHDQLILATDPDREGEAISWHIQDELEKRGKLKGKDVQRVVFNEITKSAVKEAFQHPRDVDRDLVDAYMARRALDYLVGFNLSPILWRKLPSSGSAGRVQSVALRLISEREVEIETFVPVEYWDVIATLNDGKSQQVAARLTHLDGKKLTKFSLGNETDATAAKNVVEGAAALRVLEIEQKQRKQNPAPPFTTSTMQQEASRKLGFSAAHTMRVAQKLYEGMDIDGETVGLITYMRTDGVQLSKEALDSARELITSDYGTAYLPDSPRFYKSKAKNAQEAHEAVRPTQLSRKPTELEGILDRDQMRLYQLIWKRTVACQMSAAVFDQVGVDIDVDAGAAQLRATGSVLAFDGFIKIYQEGRDDTADDDSEQRLPRLEKGQTLTREKVVADQHFTAPPPRYTEATLVKKMEEIGIGRPSTYASIISVLQDREYVRLDQKRFIPALRGRVVVAFLSNFFRRYIEYDFTAALEEQLDDISGGRLEWKNVLSAFWTDFHALIEETKEVPITKVIDVIDEFLGPYFFPRQKEDGSPIDFDPRACPSCGTGRLSVKFSKTSFFIGCGNYPDCRFTDQPIQGTDQPRQAAKEDEPIGIDPKSGLGIFLKKGPYGWYVQVGTPDDMEEGKKPKRASLLKGLELSDLTYEMALGLLALPRDVGEYEGEMITAGIGRYGPFVKMGLTYANIPEDESVLEIGLNRAVALINEKQKKVKDKAAPGTELGLHPRDGKPITLNEGRYGPYVKHGRTNATIPKDKNPKTLRLEESIALIDAKSGGKK
ncbi:type I DNA topoisomerase [Alphaproteobacteria bacterium]|nr:type I DNA topoisomerase [Alphaproteobacteria bacterium]